ncbi:TPA: hypothetical protein ACRZGX_003160, partial [Escherichia coli]
MIDKAAVSKNDDSDGVSLTSVSQVTDITNPINKTPALLIGNREVITDRYVSTKISNQPENYKYKIYIRLNAIKQEFEKVSFLHCVFDTCYFNNCSFNSCNFTGCRFIG